MANKVLFDPIQVEVWRHLLAAIAEEMGATLERTAFSPNIKERLDHSCAIFDAQGRMLAQAAHIPVHLGAMPLMLRQMLGRVTWRRGDMWICNDPRIGGTHLPDLTLVAPVYAPSPPHGMHIGRARRVGFVASRAHHADIGGMSPGSLPLSNELFQEGLILPPVRLVRRGRLQEEILALICANSRTPMERRGDLSAQIAANETGIRRFQALLGRSGEAMFATRTRENIAYAEAAIRQTLSKLKPGVYFAADVLDSDGAGAKNIPIYVTATVPGDGAIQFDFTGTASQVKGSLNATLAITRSACYYVVRCLVEEEIPNNEGCFAPIEVIAPEGTIVNARFPAAVAGGNVETSQRIVDVLLRALAPAAPERIPAASQGTMNNVTIGGYDSIRARPFSYYETIAGGAGASAQCAGASAIHTHMTNTRNTPIEALESHYPLRITELSIAEGTGGQGDHLGGNGVIRRIELLVDAHVALLTERRDHPPYGMNDGADGTLGSNTLQTPGGESRILPAKWHGDCPAGTLISIQTPGGGAWGAPRKPTLD